jgi:hypothetical protein
MAPSELGTVVLLLLLILLLHSTGGQEILLSRNPTDHYLSLKRGIFASQYNLVHIFRI